MNKVAHKFLSFKTSTMICLGLILVLGTEAQVVCNEPSTEACKLLDQSIPNFCSGNLAPLECPKYCGLCQLSCYQCSQIDDPSRCSHNVTCPDMDHACIVSETVGDDFSYHFNLGCVRKQYCSSDLPHSVVIGKRGVQKRNLKFGCCTTSLCNNIMPQQIAPIMPHSCPVGTYEYRESDIHICYYAILSLQNASESNKLCQQKFSSGRLAYIPSANAEYFMEQSLQSQFGNERGKGVWIGVFDNVQEGKFVDTDGEPQKYFNWRYDQPNDPNRNVDHDPAQDCVRSFPHDRHDQFSWQDKPCKEDGLAICSINLHK